MANQAAIATEPEFDGPTLLGHPRGLFVLFFAELWERFCYYGMRALLALYVVAQFHKPQEQASIRYGAFTALVYALGIFGGTIADRILGYRRSIVVGGLVMAVGLFLLMFPNEEMFLLGLATIIVGNGLFKPNISTIVGKLYRQGDPRRDGGFTIFYMGINMGALLAPIACQWISSVMGTAGQPDYRYGFMLAGIGVLLGVICFGLGGGLLQGQGKAPAGRTGFLPVIQVLVGIAVVIPLMYWLLGKSDWVGYILGGLGTLMAAYLVAIALKSESKVRQQMFVLLLLLCCSVVFWMCFEQAGNSLNFFAVQHINPLTIRTWSMPAEWFQSVNSIFIVAFGPIFAALWVILDKRRMNPSIPAKFGVALVLVALGFVLLISGIKGADANGKISWLFLAGLYMIQTFGELCLSPVGLSMVTKLAPEKITGMVMGAWFMSIAIGNDLAGRVSSGAGAMIDAAKDKPGIEKIGLYTQAFTPIIITALAVGIVMFLLSRWINKWMHGVK
jgi:POT family proton-dependent oligopeptide transporter